MRLLPVWSKLTPIAHTLAYDDEVMSIAPPGQPLPPEDSHRLPRSPANHSLYSVTVCRAAPLSLACNEPRRWVYAPGFAVSWPNYGSSMTFSFQSHSELTCR
jgi:hypothetical protein